MKTTPDRECAPDEDASKAGSPRAALRCIGNFVPVRLEKPRASRSEMFLHRPKQLRFGCLQLVSSRSGRTSNQ
jgi:hypothetical protein